MLPENSGDFSLSKRPHIREQSRAKTVKPGKNDVLPGDVSSLILDDVFFVDRSANREIYRHGCIYEKQVATFKQNNKCKILGFENLRPCDLFDAARPSHKSRVKKFRYFSKSSRSLLLKPPAQMPNNATETNTEPSVSASDSIPVLHSNTGGVLTTCETLNRAVYDKPNDLKSWFNLLELHGKEASFLHLSEGSTPCGTDLKLSDRLVVIRKQLAVAERALSVNPGCLSLKILMLRLEEMIVDLEAKGAGLQSGQASQPDRLDREWAQLVFTYPQMVSVWRGYLCYLMSRCGESNVNTTQSLNGGHFAKVDAVYKRALSKLSGIISGRILSHRPMAQTAEQTIDLLADYCLWLVQSGYTEKALAIWQAVVEFNCFRPAELDSVPLEQSMLEMELFWSSGAPRFGQPGSEHWRGWYRSRGKRTCDYSSIGENDKKLKEKKSKKVKSSAFILEEITPDLGREEVSSKWSSAVEQLKSIATSCEDALIRSSSDQLTDDGAQKLGAEVVPSVLSAAATDEQWVRRGAVPSLAGCASVSKSRAVLYQRGKAWFGLERAREAAGWLPADAMVTAGSQVEIEDEDPERLVLFDDIKYCLLDLNTFDSRLYGPGVNRTNLITGLQQRLLLHCLVFLGAFDPDSAAAYQLPADLLLVNALGAFGSVQRQSLAPLTTQNFQSLDTVSECGSRAKLGHLSNPHLNAWSRARRSILDTAILHAGHVKRWDKEISLKWTVTLARLRYRVTLERLIEHIRDQNLDSKTILSSWRQLGRAVMSQGQNQQDLGLWELYGSGYWISGLVRSSVADDPCDAEPLITEARRIFNTALQSHPLPMEFPQLDGSQPDKLTVSLPSIAQFYGENLAPRLELLQHYVDLELGVFTGSGGLKYHLGSELFALQLLVQVPVGGPFVQPDSISPVRPSLLVRAGHAFAKRLETVWFLLSGLSQPNVRSFATGSMFAAILSSLTRTLPTLCYLNVVFDILTSDVQCLSTSLPGFIDVLARVDRLRASVRAENGTSSDRRTTRWSDADLARISDIPTCDRICLRHFLSLIMAGLAAFAALRQRHRHAVLEQMFTIWSQKVGEQINMSMPPRELLFPNQLAYLLPSRVALERHLLPFSLSNAASLRGLLCPLFLVHFSHHLDCWSNHIGHLAADTLMDEATPGLRPVSRVDSCPLESTKLFCVNPYATPSLLRGTQLELYANCLPVSIEIIRLSVELERWSSLIGGASVNEFPGCPALGKASHCAQRVRNAFERAVRANPFFTPWLDANSQPIHAVLFSSTPSFWAGHLRLVIWRAYMAFGWMCGSSLDRPSQHSAVGSTYSNAMDPRERRQAVKAVFYRAIEDLPWAKILYTDLVRYCPEDVEEVVDLLSERELRLRTPLEEVDLLLTAKPVTR